MISGAELFKIFCDENALGMAEGSLGLMRLTRILEILGYHDTPVKRGTPIEQYLMDNLRVMQRIYDDIECLIERDPECYAAIESEVNPELLEEGKYV